VRAALLLALALAGCSSVEGGASDDRVATWGDREVTREESWDLERLVIRAGARIIVRGDGYLRVRVTELVVEGRAEIDARGAAGRALEDPVWTSSGGAFEDCEIAHRDWAQAVHDQMLVPLDTRNRGRPGGAAGRVTFIVQRTVGQPADLHVDVRGGEGGPGRVLVCGCADHPDHRYTAPSGPPGEDGQWTFVSE
jgi:hypothetical protein